MNSLSFKEALKIDKRTYIQYYISLLKKKQFILFFFYPNKDYNSKVIKHFLFFFFICSDITINAPLLKSYYYPTQTDLRGEIFIKNAQKNI